jgi:two-component system response regulator MprA
MGCCMAGEQVMADVLIVDDDPSVRAFIGFALDLEGIGSRQAENGVEALTRVAEQRPGVILLDLDMPVLDGPGFCARLDQTLGRDGMAIVVMTASSRAAAFQQTCQADAALNKPFDVADLYAAITHPHP